MVGGVPGPPSASAQVFLPSDGPVAGPIEVFTQVEVIDSPFGTLLETTFIVENSGVEDASVLLFGLLEWPDGSSTLLRYGPPVTIGADGALILIATSLVPDDVGSGPGTFTGTAILTNVGREARVEAQGPLIAQDQSDFTLP
jgi:hypothetical protein